MDLHLLLPEEGRGHHSQDRRGFFREGVRDPDGDCLPARPVRIRTSSWQRSADTGYGYAPAHNYCKEVAQETCYNVPVVTVVEPEVTVSYPEPIKTCVNKPILLPRISCADLTENKCITV